MGSTVEVAELEGQVAVPGFQGSKRPGFWRLKVPDLQSSWLGTLKNQSIGAVKPFGNSRTIVWNQPWNPWNFGTLEPSREPGPVLESWGLGLWKSDGGSLEPLGLLRPEAWEHGNFWNL